MSRRRVLALLLLLPWAPLAAQAAPEALALEAPATVAGLKVADVDGDGVLDLLVLDAREVRVWQGARGRLPAATPTWRVMLPEDVSFVDVARVQRPALLTLGASATQRIALAVDGPAAPQAIAGTAGLGWRDPTKAVFADLHPGAGRPEHLAPGPKGWVLAGEAGARPVEVAPARLTTAPGPFLEDTAIVTEGLPHVLAFGSGAAPVLWSLAGDALLRLDGATRTLYDLAFLPTSGQRRLLDVDADGVPEVVHGDGDNRSLALAFFRLKPGAAGTPPPVADLRPPFAFLKLSGFSLEPQFVDLDGDGRLDVVVTTIEIDGANVLRAVTSGRVAAQTRAFVQRAGADGAPTFAGQPDASIASDVGVKIRFGYAGNLDIARSFSILAHGDLDGDGRRDLVIRTGPDRLAVRLGTPTGVWSGEARSVAFPPLEAGEELDLHAVDLDGDRKDELVLHVRAAPGGQDRLRVLRGA